MIVIQGEISQIARKYLMMKYLGTECNKVSEPATVVHFQALAND